MIRPGSWPPQVRERARVREGLWLKELRRPVVIAMVRHPERGRVKTRLAAAIGDASALRVYRAFLADLAASFGSDPRWRFQWCFPPPDAPFREIEARGLKALPQGQGDLGERMSRALREALEGAPVALAIGSDMPHLPPEWVAQAIEMLAGSADVVIGPAEDGGYYLLGVRRVHPIFAGIEWGGPTVLAATRELVRVADLRVSGASPSLRYRRAGRPSASGSRSCYRTVS